MKIGELFNVKEESRALILVDCEGTLFDVLPHISENTRLLELMAVLHDEPCFKVVAMAENPAAVQERFAQLCDKYLSDPQYFGAVKDKADFDGADAMYVFDDDHASHKIKTGFAVDPADMALLERWTNKFKGLIGAVELHFNPNALRR